MQTTCLLRYFRTTVKYFGLQETVREESGKRRGPQRRRSALRAGLITITAEESGELLSIEVAGSFTRG
jgi:hypothetical protein